MTIENDFLAFAAGGSANVETQAAYVADTSTLQNGFQSGIANSSKLNKVWRQSSIMSAVLAQFVCDLTGQNAIDDGTTATLLANLKSAVALQTPGRLLNVQTFTSSGTYTPTTGTTSIIVDAVGGGGGGGACPSTSAGQQAAAAGGLNGMYAQARFTSGFSGVAVTIGAQGSGGASGSNAGSSGGTTSFGSLLSCAGGAGGSAGVASSSSSTLSPQTFNTTLPTISGGALLKYQTRRSGQGFIVLGVASGTVLGGGGGDSPFGVGGVTVMGAAGNAATGYGAGGGGASQYANETGGAGGNGSPSLVMVWEYA